MANLNMIPSVSHETASFAYQELTSCPFAEYQPTREEVAENHEDILHPLREAANRVGREVERFAEVLDGYNPLKAIDDADKKDMTFDLIDSYHDIALETVKRLRAAHFRRKDGGAGRKKIHGFAIARDPDAMDEDESDDQEPLDLNSKTTLQDLERWEQEARTWDLLRRMTTLQYDPPKVEDAPQIHRYSPERQIWNSFLQNDTLGLERNTVLDWLKITADESGEDIDVLVQELQQNAERGDITAHGWLHTKSAIKSQKRLHAWPYVLDHTSPDVQLIHLNASKTEALVTELDPDAPVRQGRKLEAPDEYFERAIWHGCYELLRRGKSGEEIREWCRDRQEIWRAVSMSGLPDENLDSDEAASDSNSKALWRRMCYALSKRGGTDKYENAVYGILAGDFWSVAPVCRTWDDHLFVHYNALVRSQYEVYVQKHFPSRAPQDAVQSIDAFDAISFHGVPETVGPRTVALLNNKSELQTETRQPMKMLQGVLIAKEFHSYVYEQGVAISKAANVPGGSTSVLIANLNVDPKDAHKIHYIKTEDFDSLRVLTHMLLAFKSLGMSFGDKMQTYAIENVIVAYISFLRLAGKEELIPLYAAQLSDERAYATLGRELLDVTDPEQRVTQIKLMKELGLDVQRFVRLQMKFLMDDYPDTEKGYPATGKFSVLLEARPMNEGVPLVRRIRPDFMGDTVDRPEMLMIRAFEWYQYVEGMWSETFRTGTMLYKRFFKHMKLAAARQLKNSTPARDIAANKTPVILGEAYELSDLTAEVEEDEDVPEELDDKAAEITRLLKRHMAEEARTFQDLEKLVHALDFIEGVAGIIDALEISQV